MEQFQAKFQDNQEFLSKKINQATQTIIDAFSNYNQSDIILSFNGGKDCTVVLYLILLLGYKCDLVWFGSDDNFQEVEQFVDLTVSRFQLRIVKFATQNYKEGMKDLVNQGYKVIFMGTRSTDPNSSNLGLVNESSPGWPQFLRVMPIIYWSYQDI